MDAVRAENAVLKEKLVEEGPPWVYLIYCPSPKCHEWEQLQVKAQQGKRGLWRDSRPVPPWEFRKRRL